ncbi:MAG TPA: ABC-F family ATP-binding cassette domain-containing protein [Candidatus Sulfotelmatobacter sp.]|jgi:ATP-binding cassette subfamily F protein 3|nr:ABC-F family ATP-binding cassette domain-containing protein [Candidatus Sulfotelmatobacter sp.]
MIQLSGAGKRFGHKLLFENTDWLITPHDRVGLVGANGTGKSTLMKVLAGLDTLDYGSLIVAKGTTAGYLPQDGLSLSGRTVFAECMTVFSDLHAMERELEELTHKISELDHTSPEYADVADRYHSLEHEFQTRGGYSIEAEVGRVLQGLGFQKADWERQTDEFSGGWQMRLALAKLLLQKPNLLLLDEPTNHLDLEARNWLEEYLHDYPHALVLISHDRYFLDVVVNRIAEIWNKRFWFYTGNYDKFLSQKTQRNEQLQAAYKNQRDRIEQLEVFINRFRYQATKAKQVQSRIKELEKIERIEVPPEEKTIHFSFPQPKPSGRIVAEFENVAKVYPAKISATANTGEKEVFRGVNFMIEKGDRIALVGVNGAGKSTLIKLLAGAERPTQGEYKLGHNVEADYFAQDQYKELDANARMIDDLGNASPGSTQTELRSLLGCFLFSEDDVFKKIGVLSGGERGRYALLRLLLHPANFLLLDEPTNHLDLRAKDVLLESLMDYTGTVVFVSHDRYFIDKLATRVFEIGDGKVEVYPGNYEDYLWRKQGGSAKQEETIRQQLKTVEAAPPTPANGNQAPPAEVAPAKAKRLNPIKRKKMEDRIRELEGEISRAETSIAQCETALQDFVSADESQRQSQELDRQKAAHAGFIKEWEDLSQSLQEAD